MECSFMALECCFFLEAEETEDHQSPGPVLIIFGMAYVIIILRLPPKFEALCRNGFAGECTV
jgi:hypothetical protein